MENNKTPRIRFKGFTDPWEQRKLGDFCEMFNGDRGINYPKDSDMVQAGIPFVNAGDLQEGKVNLATANKITREKFDQLGGAKIKRGDILYCLRGTLGKNAFVDNFDEGTVASSLVDIRPKNVDSQYLFTVLNSDIEYRQRILCDEGAAQPNLSARNLANFDIPVPKIEEQVKIGRYFESLSNLITLHQRKYNKLLNVKKSMLEKMFPKNGSNIPEIRFKGFTDPWEQRKLGELADIVGGGTPSTGVSDYWDGDIDWYAPAEIAEQIYLTSSQRKITEEGYNHSSAKMLPVGTVLFTSRAGIGKTAILTQKGCTNQGFQSIVPHKIELDSYFIFSRTEELKQYGETVGAGSTFVEVSGKQMANMELMMPKTMAEQKTIGQYFASLDNLITLHQRELEKLQNIKKSMLEKMFV